MKSQWGHRHLKGGVWAFALGAALLAAPQARAICFDPDDPRNTYEDCREERGRTPPKPKPRASGAPTTQPQMPQSPAAEPQAAQASGGGSSQEKFVKLLCSDEPHGFLRGCAQAIQLQKEQLEKLIVGKKVACYYKEVDTDLFAASLQSGQSGASQGAKADGCQVGKWSRFDKLCNLAAGEESRPDSKWGASYDCGKPMVTKQAKAYAWGTVGTAESRYMTGAFAQSLISCKNRVLGEIEQGRGLKVKAFSGVAAQDLAKKGDVFRKLADKVRQSGELEESGAVESYCSDQTGNSAGKTEEQTKHLEAVCYLAAARATQESSFTYLAVGEIQARQTALWALSLPKLKDAQMKVASDCTAEAQSKTPKHRWGCCGKLCPGFACVESQDAGEFEANYNSCYKSKLAPALKAKTLELFPEDGATCNYAANFLGFAWGLAGLKRRKKGGRPANRALPLLLLACLLSSLSAALPAHAFEVEGPSAPPAAPAPSGPAAGQASGPDAGRIGGYEVGGLARGDGWVNCSKVTSGNASVIGAGCELGKSFTDTVQDTGEDVSNYFGVGTKACAGVQDESARSACSIGTTLLAVVLSPIALQGILAWEGVKLAGRIVVQFVGNLLASVWNLLVNVVCGILGWIGWTPGFCVVDKTPPEEGAKPDSACVNSMGINVADEERVRECCNASDPGQADPSAACGATFPAKDMGRVVTGILPKLDEMTAENLKSAAALVGESPDLAMEGSGPGFASQAASADEARRRASGGSSAPSSAPAGPTARSGGASGGTTRSMADGPQAGTGFGGLSTAPAGAPQSAPAAVGSSGGVTYAGGTGTGAGSAPGLGMGLATAVEGEGGSSALDLSGARSEVSPYGSADPEDYFTRIGVEEDLFKKVEKRYRGKSSDWAREGAAKGKALPRAELSPH